MNKNLKTGMAQKLRSFVVDEAELHKCVSDVNHCLYLTYKKCFEAPSLAAPTNTILIIDSVLDYLHDELNTGHWSDIPVEIRKAFTGASFIKTLLLLEANPDLNETVLKESLRILDMGLLLGAPLEKNSEIMVNSASFLSQQFNETLDVTSNKNTKSDYEDEFHHFEGAEIDTLNCPSLETFTKYFTSKTPLKLCDCINHWPAMTKWIDVNYLLKVAGHRTVPVEIGSHYTDENWRQKLMTVKEFIKRYFLEESEGVGYLAQHNLFNQIPELKNDIYMPEYCCVSDRDDGEEPQLNAWFGPANTVSPLHHDPKNNILVQVFGKKQLLLYSPKDSPYLYPHESSLLFNTAQVDPFKPDHVKYPNFKKATAYKCSLEAGQMLYIPPKWWHHVTAVEKSFSVSFWWE